MSVIKMSKAPRGLGSAIRRTKQRWIRKSLVALGVLPKCGKYYYYYICTVISIIVIIIVTNTWWW